MNQFSANGQGHVTQSRTEMDLQQLHAAYDALLLDKMQVIDQKDVLYEQNADLRLNLEAVTSALEASEEYRTSHGSHFVAIEARKLLTKLSTKGTA